MKRTIVKLFAVFVLVGIIVGISVIKSSVSAKREANRVTSIKDEYFKTQDSLLLARLDDSTRFYIDSILRMETFYQSQIDSLNRFYAEKDSLQAIEEVGKKKAADSITSSKKQVAKSKPKKIATVDNKSQKLKSDFDSISKDLPGDLTKYEKEVSVRELVIDLSNKYKISPDSVRKILSQAIKRL
jgi:hypothetical protein